MQQRVARTLTPSAQELWSRENVRENVPRFSRNVRFTSDGNSRTPSLANLKQAAEPRPGAKLDDPVLRSVFAMNQTLSAVVQSFTPPIIWNSYQRLRGRAQRFAWRDFGNMITCANSKPLLEGKFAALYAKYHSLDPFPSPKKNHYRNYNVCFFADFCRHIPGDFVCAGVSHGVTPRIVFDFVDFLTLGKTLHLIDPFEGIVSNDSKAISEVYNRDPDYVLRQYPPEAPIVLHRARIPLHLPGRFAFVFTDTGNPVADAESLPIFYEALNPGGVFITDQYANYIDHYEPVLSRLGVTPLWLPSGQGVIIKQ
jgi:hypothetical protein